MGQKYSALFMIKNIFNIKKLARHCTLLIRTRWENVLRIVFLILILTNSAVWMQARHPARAVANVAPTPVGYWKFDEGSGTTASDSSGNGSTGAITGAGWVAGQVNGALSFNGSTNYVSMGTPVPTALKFGASSFTVINWFKTTSTTMGRMVSEGVFSYSTGFDLTINVTNTCSAGCVGGELGGGNPGATVSFGTTATTFNDNHWHQAAMVIDQSANTGQIYVDGVVQALSKQTGTCGTLGTTSIDFTACNAANATNSSDPFTLGAYHSGATNAYPFAGSLDEVRVYNSALTSTDIVNQYASDTGTSLSPQAISVYGQGTGNIFNTNATGTSQTTFNNVRRVVLDSNGGLYESEITNNRVLYFPSGAKTATRVYGQNATGTNFTSGTANLGGSVAATTLNTPKGLALDSAGNLYVADSGNNRVLFYPISGGIAAVSPTRVYGQGAVGNTFGVAATGITNVGMNAPTDVTLDSQNNLYVADASNNRVLYFPSTGGAAGTADFTATRLWGQSAFGAGFGTANRCACTTPSNLTLSNPVAVQTDSSGGLYVADATNNRVVYYPTWTANNMAATHVYGQTTFAGFTANQGGSISATTLYSPYALALDSNNDLYVSDNLNNRVLYYPPWTANPMAATRVYGQLGNFTTGTTNHCSCTTDSNSSLNGPVGLNLDPTGHLYVADSLNNRILEFWTHLAVTTQPPATTPPLNTFSMASGLIDDGSQLVFSDFTGAVAVAITTGTAGATLSGTTSVNAINGVASFSNLSIDKQGTGYILTVSNALGGSATTSAFNIATLTLAGYWPLSEGSGATTADLSGNGDTGTISGATWTTGEVGGALSFTGTTNYVTMGTPTPLKFGASSFTAISWFKTSVTTIGRMVGEGVNNYSSGFDLSVSATSTCSAGCVSAEIGGGNKGATVAFGTTVATFNDNNWHQAAMVIDQSANTGQIYVDGVVQALTKQTGTCGTVGTTSIDFTLCGSANATSSSDPFTLGAYHSGASTLFAFVGGLDEVRVYNAALTSAQVLSQYNIDNTASPAGYWPLDEGTGTTTADRSSLGTSTGTLSGGTLPTWITGKVNNALSFNGTTGYVTMGTPTALNFGTGNFTFMSWFKVANGYKGHGRIVSLGVNGYLGGFDMEMNLNNVCVTNGGCIGGEVGSPLGTAAGFLSFNTSGTTGASIYNDGNWHQAAMVINRTLNTAQIFVDGTAQLVSTQSGDCASATAAISVNISGCPNLTATSGVDPFALGADRSSTTTSSPMTGSLDEVRVYGSALTSSQIQNQYNIDASPLTETATNQSFSGSLGTTANYTLPIALTYQLASAPGWSITITSTTLTSGANTLPNTSSTITGVTGVCISSGTCLGGVGGDTLTNTISGGTFPLTIPAAGAAPTATKFFGTAAGTGKGAYTVTPSISVVIPATVNVGTYTSTITLTAASGP